MVFANADAYAVNRKYCKKQIILTEGTYAPLTTQTSFHNNLEACIQFNSSTNSKLTGVLIRDHSEY